MFPMGIIAKRILLLLVVLGAMILPATAATKSKNRGKHVATRSKKAKSVRSKSGSHRSRSTASKKHTKTHRAA